MLLVMSIASRLSGLPVFHLQSSSASSTDQQSQSPHRPTNAFSGRPRRWFWEEAFLGGALRQMKPRTGGIRWQSVQVAINGGSAEKKALVRRGQLCALAASLR